MRAHTYQPDALRCSGEWTDESGEVVARCEGGHERGFEELRRELEHWQNIAEARLGDERKMLKRFRNARTSASRVEEHKANIRRLTAERDALKNALGWDAALAIIRAQAALPDDCPCDWHGGRITHTHACPKRMDPFCMTHPHRCDPPAISTQGDANE